MTKLTIPLILSDIKVVITLAIIVFLWSYNDLFSALIFVNKESVRPVVALLNEISSQYGTRVKRVSYEPYKWFVGNSFIVQVMQAITII